jgi:hypothetical protein
LDLTSLATVTRWPILQKVRHYTSKPRKILNSALTVCKHTVSGSFSLPSRGAFHLSLTVLSAIGCQVVFSLGRWSSLLPTGFHVSGGTRGYIRQLTGFRLRDFHPLRSSFPGSFSFPISFLLPDMPACISRYTPQPHINNGCSLTLIWFGLFLVRSPLLEESQLISFPPVT